MDPQSDRARLLVVCAAAPGVFAIAVSAAVVLAGIAGGAPPFWRGGSLTLSEAAALHDQGELVRLIDSGSDPNATYLLRPNVLAFRSLTPLEAAVGARRAEMVDLLMLHGARIDGGMWRRLHCFAIETGGADVVQTLDHFRPSGAEGSCEGVKSPY